MPVFEKNKDKSLKKLDNFSFDNEKMLQSLIENNLEETLELKFLASEYTTTQGDRIDTLAVGTEDGAPVIIEYKKNQSKTVVNQALYYLQWLKTQKREFFKQLMRDKLSETEYKEIDLNWSNPRIICVAESFSRYDLATISLVSESIDLYRYRNYDGIFTLESITDHKRNSQIKKTINKTKQESNELSPKTVEDHSCSCSKEISDLFHKLRELILNLDESIEEKSNQNYIAYKLSNTFANIKFQKNKLKIHVRYINYDDPDKKVGLSSGRKSTTWSNYFHISSAKEIDYAISLIEQSYKDVL